MKKRLFLNLLIVFLVSTSLLGQTKTDPWNAQQLKEPNDLAAVIKTRPSQAPLIICVGPSALIKGSVDAGPAREQENLDHLKSLLSKEPRNREVVIYCGCCPFERCPNIRPAFTLLKQMKFKNARLLNLPHNLKTDWIDKGYPITD